VIKQNIRVNYNILMSENNKTASEMISDLNKLGQKVKLEPKQDDLLNDLKESLKSTIDETSLIFSSLIEVLDSTLNDEETIKQIKGIVDNLIFDYNKTVQDTSGKIKNLQQIKYHYLEEE
tara:strand:- start:76 stop:435 length:360 start_codon:yes stop_codon:yes gene_type:complete